MMLAVLFHVDQEHHLIKCIWWQRDSHIDGVESQNPATPCLERELKTYGGLLVDRGMQGDPEFG